MEDSDMDDPMSPEESEAALARLDPPGCLPRTYTRGARDTMSYKMGYTVDGNGVWNLIHGVEALTTMVNSLQAELRSVRDELRDFKRKAGPSLSAARGLIPRQTRKQARSHGGEYKLPKRKK